MAIKWLRKQENELIVRLLESLDEYAGSVMEDTPEYKPFHGRENASVAMLVAAASRIGLLPLSEFPVHKKNWNVAHRDPPIRLKNLDSADVRFPCWADFWVSDGNDSNIMIEFKQTTGAISGNGDLIYNNLRMMMHHARSEVSRADEEEAKIIMGGLFAPVWDGGFSRAYNNFASECEWACCISHRSGKYAYEVYVYLDSRRA